MDIRLTVTVLGVLLVQAHGHPRASEESVVSSSGDIKRIIPVEVSSSGDTKRIIPVEVSGSKDSKKIDSLDTFAEKEVKKTAVGEKEESPGKLKVPLTSLGAKLKARLPEDSKLPTTSKEAEEEAVRPTRQLPSQSSPYHQMSVGKGPHTTTVCIQVRSDHNPRVICGPEYAEREDPSPPPPPAAARYAAPYEFTRPHQGYAQSPPAPARGYPMRRNEEEMRPLDPNALPASGFGPQNSLPAPTRLLPSAPPSPSPVYVQSHQYNPSLYSGQLVSPLQALMRLNCAVEPNGQLVSPQLIRGGYLDQAPGDAIYNLQDGSKFGANIGPPAPIRSQNLYATPPGYAQRARSSSDEDMAYLNSQMLGSAQDFGAYPGDYYLMDMMQGRSANGEDRSQAYLRYPNEYIPSADDFAKREYIQLQALRESKEKLKEIEEELTAYRQREELLKTSSKNSSSETSKENSQNSPVGGGISIDITAKPTKASKRQTRTQ